MESGRIALNHHLLNEKEKREICTWRYPGEYSVYNLPSFEEMLARRLGFLNPERKDNYRAYYDGTCFVGFTNLLEEENAVFVGIGVNPAFCNRGYGLSILNEAFETAKRLYPGKPLYLEVRAWNLRAVRCYQKAGFQIEGEPFEQETEIGTGTFYRMVRK